MTLNDQRHPWWQVAVISGCLATLSYTLSVFAPLPYFMLCILAFSFGPFLMAAVFALFRLLDPRRNSIPLQLGTLFMQAAGIVVTLMFVVQQTSFALHAQLATTPAGISKEIHRLVFQEVNAVQLGMDLAWDIFLCAGTFGVALGLWNHPVFKRIIPALGMLLSLLLITLNLYTFPQPPAAAGSPDLGPLVASWWTLLTMLTIFRRKKFLEPSATTTQAAPGKIKTVESSSGQLLPRDI